MNKISVISIINSRELNAGPKAKSDITSIILKNFNSEELVLDINTDPNKSGKFPYLMINLFKKIVFLKRIKKNNNIKIFQYPVMRNTNLLKKYINYDNCILLIHDIKTIRDQINDNSEFDFINRFQYIICHNNAMKKVLVNHGIDSKKLFCLEIFDYISDNNEEPKTFNVKNIRIAYTGNLVKTKVPFLYQISQESMNYTLVLYGIGYDKNNVNSRIEYKGSFNPDELPCKITEPLGLVWDGDAISEKDENVGFKNYDKYISPHKLSCYLAAGIPVIVWEKLGEANFVKNENIGYLIKNVNDINKIDFSDYSDKKRNAERISSKIRNGEYTIKTINKIINKMEEKNE